ncbi:hypothetical protein U5922_004670 [Aquicoccus sp. G2-2]|uniref:hypothetical protein n=1 Tax=Aquicoccus sp. G2-2 TaxID=3092120 RepID=UPI002ADF292A|nr:hypothetical protein [Aquicoccus sp. G2-2]MEA1112801.1 hypothetical protein [Aquicoccus sp. G2-2]
MVWIGAVLGLLVGIYQAKRRKGSALDMAQWGAVYCIIFALIALIIDIVLIRFGLA